MAGRRFCARKAVSTGSAIWRAIFLIKLDFSGETQCHAISSSQIQKLAPEKRHPKFGPLGPPPAEVIIF